MFKLHLITLLLSVVIVKENKSNTTFKSLIRFLLLRLVDSLVLFVWRREDFNVKTAIKWRFLRPPLFRRTVKSLNLWSRKQLNSCLIEKLWRTSLKNLPSRPQLCIVSLNNFSSRMTILPYLKYCLGMNSLIKRES